MITVIGHDGAPPAGEAAARLAAAALVVGRPRDLAAASPDPARTLIVDDPLTALDAIDAASADGEVVVLAAGDPGYFGVVRALRDRGHRPLVLPAVSTVARAFARASLPWDDALVVSAPAPDALRRAANVCRAHPKVAVLTGPGAGPAELARELFPQTPRTFVVCEDLGGPRERVVHVRPAEATTRPWNDPEAVLVLDPRRAVGEPAWLAGARPGPAGWALPDEAFEPPGPSPVPPEVRAFVLARLGPRLGDLVWDIGAGDGAVAVECARFGAAAVAVDRNAAACTAIRANVRAHGVKVAVSLGTAPDVLDHLPVPDAVFVGGGGPQVLRACAARALRAVVTVADEPGQAAATLETAGFTARSVLISGDMGTPMFVVWGDRGAPPAGRPAAAPARRIETIKGLPG
ncbi:precorrin-6y C5,15-methyltransferase (decarboxylating) subunit CbiE [Actinomadura macrotermitis]|uniref:Tetrapyrrole methylase domain-containing protein n=1 Tax=Actinomadura macrotermitis TaxID=2585200 RepID=A0A7K0BYX3_9ACTN|nr:precorrin-6y C5,15-methyltransferase (decarboxylating) subunit CbiE [Actinomadura macrotermitis]MQY06381.1 hypothetical protein [Actinomadura macrotermitis]